MVPVFVGSGAARLLVGWQRIGAGGRGRGAVATEGSYKTFAQLHPKTTLRVGGRTEIEDVWLEAPHRGGVVLPDAAAVGKW